MASEVDKEGESDISQSKLVSNMAHKMSCLTKFTLKIFQPGVDLIKLFWGKFTHFL
jgi:hypothetical protein